MTNQNFMNDLNDELVKDPDETYNISVTENGAIGYATSGSKFVDAMFSIPKFRGMYVEELAKVFADLYVEYKHLAILFMFYLGDIRGGAGERRSFRYMFETFCFIDQVYASKFIKFIPEYSRWDIVFEILFTATVGDKIDAMMPEIETEIVSLVKDQVDYPKFLSKDYGVSKDISIIDGKEQGSLSLIGKWLPSYNTSSHHTKIKAQIVADKCFGLDIVHNPNDQRTYRKMISKLRKALKIVESSMSSNNWDDINYSAVPSKANLKYSKAFKKHDPERYAEYLNKGSLLVDNK